MSALDMTGARRHPRADFVLRVLLSMVIGWAGFVLLATFLHGHLPSDPDRRRLLYFAAAAVTVVSFKTFQMSAPVRHWTLLGASLVALNIAFDFTYIVAVVFSVWTQYQRNGIVRDLVYGSVAVAGAFACYELMQIPGKNDDARPRLTVALALAATAIVLALCWRLGVIG